MTTATSIAKDLHDRVSKLEEDLARATASRDAWYKAWEDQRDIIGQLALKLDSVKSNILTGKLSTNVVKTVLTVILKVVCVSIRTRRHRQCSR